MALAIVAVVKMVSRISGIGAIITKHEHVAVSNGYGKRAVAWIHAGLKISAFINGFAVDRDGSPDPLQATVSPGRPMTRLIR